MSEPVAHCPFLNRSDSRCSESFKLDRLRHALQYCFDDYHACPVYAQLLAERQARRLTGSPIRAGRQTNGGFRDGSVVVQISLPARHAQPKSAAA
jgi:hypothetical protein